MYCQVGATPRPQLVPRPIYPPEPWVRGPSEGVVARAHAILAEYIPTVEYLIGYEGDAFASSGDARADILAITAVHPLRDSAVRELLTRSGAGPEVVDDLISDGLVVRVEHARSRFLVRRFGRRRPR